MKYGYTLIGYRFIDDGERKRRVVAMCQASPPRFHSGLDAQHAGERAWDELSSAERTRLDHHEIQITTDQRK